MCKILLNFWLMRIVGNMRARSGNLYFIFSAPPSFKKRSRATIKDTKISSWLLGFLFEYLKHIIACHFLFFKRKIRLRRPNQEYFLSLFVQTLCVQNLVTIFGIKHSRKRLKQFGGGGRTKFA